MPYLAAIFFLLAFFPVFAQKGELPSEIRGYKVYRDTVTVSTDANSKTTDLDAFIKIGDPTLVDASVSGVTFELSGELRSLVQSGKVDFLTFKDFRVNGLEVEVEEYAHPFVFRKDKSILLPKPARIFLPANSILHAAWKEIRESKFEWNITGRVFVFGRFRRFGFHHKRVVPVDIDVKIKNPIQSLSPFG
jgi:hypothetical protein